MATQAQAQSSIVAKPAALSADIEAMKVLNQHWLNDNNVINAKLVQYVAVQSLLVLAREKVAFKTPSAAVLWPFLGALTSACWFFSMGRTYELREQWRGHTRKLIDRMTGLEAFDFLETKASRWYGSVSTGWVQLGIPATGFFIWVIALTRFF